MCPNDIKQYLLRIRNLGGFRTEYRLIYTRAPVLPRSIGSKRNPPLIRGILRRRVLVTTEGITEPQPSQSISNSPERLIPLSLTYYPHQLKKPSVRTSA